jgi:Protein of unknown function (DUF2909).
MKIIIVMALLAIIASLTSALYFLIKKPLRPEKMVKALTFRIGLSIALFAFMLLAFWSGWIVPHGV